MEASTGPYTGLVFDVVLLTPHTTFEAFAQQLHDLPIELEHQHNTLYWGTVDGWVRCIHLDPPHEHGFDPSEPAFRLMQQRHLAAFLVWYGHSNASQDMARQILQHFLEQDAYILDQAAYDHPRRLSEFLAGHMRF